MLSIGITHWFKSPASTTSKRLMPRPSRRTWLELARSPQDAVCPLHHERPFLVEQGRGAVLGVPPARSLYSGWWLALRASHGSFVPSREPRSQLQSSLVLRPTLRSHFLRSLVIDRRTREPQLHHRRQRSKGSTQDLPRGEVTCNH